MLFSVFFEKGKNRKNKKSKKSFPIILYFLSQKIKERNRTYISQSKSLHFFFFFLSSFLSKKKKKKKERTRRILEIRLSFCRCREFSPSSLDSIMLTRERIIKSSLSTKRIFLASCCKLLPLLKALASSASVFKRNNDTYHVVWYTFQTSLTDNHHLHPWLFLKRENE